MTDKSVVPIDWSQPIEAVHLDGRVVSVTLNPYPLDKMASRTTIETPDPQTTNNDWNEDGSDWCHLKQWTIRNVASNPLSLETSDLDPITPEEDVVATAILAAVGRTRQSLHTVVRAIRDGLVKVGAVIVPVEPTEAMIEAAGGAEYDPSRWDDPSVRPCEIWSAMLSAHSIQSGGEGGAS